jgi:hypothetical protein
MNFDDGNGVVGASGGTGTDEEEEEGQSSSRRPTFSSRNGSLSVFAIEELIQQAKLPEEFRRQASDACLRI